MKTKLSILFLLVSFFSFAQATSVIRGQFTNKPTGTALTVGATLDLSAETRKGILPPRGTTTDRNMIATGSDQNGMLFFNTTTNQYEYYDHPTTSWKAVADGQASQLELVDNGGGDFFYRLLGSGTSGSGGGINFSLDPSSVVGAKSLAGGNGVNIESESIGWGSVEIAGFASIAVGENLFSGKRSAIFGYDNYQNSGGGGQLTAGGNNSNQGESTFVAGSEGIASAQGDFGGMVGRGGELNAPYQFTTGYGNKPQAEGSTWVGVLGTEESPTEDNFRIFNVGNGNSEELTNSDAFSVFQDGTASLPTSTISEITALGDKGVATVEFVNAAIAGGGDFVQKTGDTMSGDLIFTEGIGIVPSTGVDVNFGSQSYTFLRAQGSDSPLTVISNEASVNPVGLTGNQYYGDNATANAYVQLQKVQEVVSLVATGTNTGDEILDGGSESYASKTGHTWTFSPVNLSGTNVTSTLPTTRGGTGLTSIGTALQYFRVNAAGTALEYASPIWLPLAGGTMTGTITSQNITPSANNTYSIGASASSLYSAIWASMTRTNGVRTANSGGNLGFQTSDGTNRLILYNSGRFVFGGGADNGTDQAQYSGTVSAAAATSGGQLVRYDQIVPFTATATLDFPSISPQSQQGLTITVTGAVVGKPVSLGYGTAAVMAGVMYTAYVSAADTVTVQASNITTSSKDPASASFTVNVSR